MTRVSPIAALVVAAMTRTTSAATDCPDDWNSSPVGDDQKVFCCPGLLEIENGYCCVSKPVSRVPLTFTGNPAHPLCAATVRFKDPDYSSKASAASASVHGRSVTQAASTSATTTGESGGSPTTTARSSGDAAAGNAASTTATGAAAMATSEIIAGIVAAAAAFAL